MIKARLMPPSTLFAAGKLIALPTTRRYLRNFDLKKKKWPQIESYLSRELREDVARNKEDTRIEGLQTVVTGVEQRLAAIGEQLRKSQQLIIVAAIALAIVLYFRH